MSGLQKLQEESFREQSNRSYEEVAESEFEEYLLQKAEADLREAEEHLNKIKARFSEEWQAL